MDSVHDTFSYEVISIAKIS